MGKTMRQRILSGVTSGVMTLTYLLGSPAFLKGRRADALDDLVYPLRRGSPEEYLESSTLMDALGGRDPAVLLGGQNAADENGEPLVVPLDVQQTLQNFTDTYALGIASQFCVFLQDDMKVWESDAEGRVAIGGDAIIATSWNGYSFAKGDYGHQIPLSDLLDDHGYAHMIVGGNVRTNSGAVGLANDGYYNTEYPFVNAQLVPSDGDLRSWCFQYKDKILVLNDDDPERPVNETCLEDNSAPGNRERGIDKTQTYVTKLFDFDEQFAMLRQRSEAISENAKDSPLQDDAVTIQYGTATFDANLKGKIQDVVTFNISADKWAEISACGAFKFENIPKLITPRKVVHADDETCTVKYEYWDNAYIVINVYDDNGGMKEYKVAGGDVTTTINGINVSNVGGFMSNNHPGVTSLLYNFSQANSLKLPGNFQGTLLAPNADVTDGANQGHLSGALIAKSFDGKTEFGYRPYTGPSSVLGLNVKYLVKVQKTDQSGRENVKGATFGLFRIENGTETLVSSAVTDENGTASLTALREGEYVLRETAPAPGYALGDTEYHFTISKNDDKQKVKFSKGQATVPGDTKILTLDEIAAREGKDKSELTFDWLRDNHYVVIGNPEADSDVGRTLKTLGSDHNQPFGMYDVWAADPGITVNSVTLWVSGDPIVKTISAKTPSITFQAEPQGTQYVLTGDRYKLDSNILSHVYRVTADVTVADEVTGTISANNEKLNAEINNGSGVYTLYESDEPLGTYEPYNTNYTVSDPGIVLNSVTFTTDIGDAFTYDTTAEYDKITFAMNGTGEPGKFTMAELDSTGYIVKNDTLFNNEIERFYKVTADVTVDPGASGTVNCSNGKLVKQVTGSDPALVMFDNSVAPDPDNYTYYYIVQPEDDGQPGIYSDANGYLSDPPHQVAVFSQDIPVSSLRVDYTDGEDAGTSKTFQPLDSAGNVYLIGDAHYQFEAENTGDNQARITKVLKEGEDVTAAEASMFRAQLLLDQTDNPIQYNGQDCYWITNKHNVPYEPLIDITPEHGYPFKNQKAIRLMKTDTDNGNAPLAGASMLIEGFTVDAGGNAGEPTDSLTWKSDEKGLTLAAVKNGLLANGNIAPMVLDEGEADHVYRLSETAAPAGYMPSEKDVWFFVRGGKLYYKETAAGAAPGVISDPFAGWTAVTIEDSTLDGRTVRFGNEKFNQFEMRKLDSSTGNVMTGAQLRLIKILSGKAESSTDPVSLRSLTLDTDYEEVKDADGTLLADGAPAAIRSTGVFKMKSLPAGKYAVVETSVPMGYNNSAQNLVNVFEWTADGRVNVLRAVDGFTASASDGRLTVSLANIRMGSKFTFEKANENGERFSTDAATGNIENLDGLVIKVFEYDSAAGTWTERSSREKTAFFEATLSTLANNRIYRIEETGAPAGYSLAKPIYIYKSVTGAGPGQTTKFYKLDMNDPANAEKDFAETANYTEVEGVTENRTTVYKLQMKDEKQLNQLALGKIDNKRKFDDSDPDNPQSVFAPEPVVGAGMKLTLVKPFAKSATLADVTADQTLIAKTDTAVEWVSAAEKINLSGLPDGEYLLTEESTPVGYYSFKPYSFRVINGVLTELSEDSITGTVAEIPVNDPRARADVVASDQTGTDSASVEAVDELYTLLVRKVTDQLVGTDYAHLPGARMQLTGTDADGAPVDFTDIPLRNNKYKGIRGNLIKENDLRNEPEAEYTISADGKTINWTSIDHGILFEGLPDGSYTLTELRAPLGYKKSEPIEFVIENHDVVLLNGEPPVFKKEVNMTDETATPVSITVNKKDKDGYALGGAVFTLSGTDENENPVVFSEGSVAVAGGQVMTDSGKVLMWESGITPAVIQGLYDGTYILKEITPPVGYAENPNPITIVIKDGKLDSVDGKNAAASEDITLQVDVTNLKDVTKVQINKTDADDKGLADAELALVSLTVDPETGKVTGEKAITDGAWTSNGDLTKPQVFEDLAAGKYAVKETEAPEGYCAGGTLLMGKYLAVFDIAADGSLENFEAADGNINVSGKTVTITLRNRKEGPKVSVSKKAVAADGEELAGAQITLTGKDAEGNDIVFRAGQLELGKNAALISGSGESLSWRSGTEETVISDLADGTYTLHETAAPNGYVVTSDVTFTVTDGKASKTAVVLVDQKTKVTISKTNITGDEEIAGAKLQVIDKATGKVIDAWTSEAGKSHVIEGVLNADTVYILHEAGAPDGYAYAADIEFKVNADGKVVDDEGNETVVVMKDASAATVKINKADQFGAEVKGAMLTLTGKDADDNDIVFAAGSVEIGKEAKLINGSGDALVWISGIEATNVKNLPDGKYNLHEQVNPEGYEV
ncbi:MAG: choice-of-anchor A family protein, partial [Oscillospiraceae bacterium]|nr:choice-of-anchor A family protein [Oscillospiraceae bacterium]